MKPDVIEVEPGVYSVLLDGVSYEVRQGAGWISIDGESFPHEREDPRRWTRGGASATHTGKAALTAPMPGKVVRILVNVGDKVEAGQSILVVEAMKMQNELKSPRAATVVSINIKAGEGVNAGATLAVLE